jgi:hypothetical protein
MTYTSPLDGMTFDEPGRDTGDLLLEHYASTHSGKPRDELLGRRAECIARAAELKGYGRLSQAQAREADDLIAEQIILDDLVSKSDVEIRRAKIEHLERVAADPANREGPESGSRPGDAPALVTRPGDQPETAQQIIARSGNPWAARSGPLDGHASYGRGDPPRRASSPVLISRWRCWRARSPASCPAKA